MSTNPIVFCNGDETTRVVAESVREKTFHQLPTHDVDTGVKSRLDSGDLCLSEAARALKRFRAGVKISTASDDPRIKERGMGSANMDLRPQAGVFAMERSTLAGGTYQKPVTILRYGHGGFYDEHDCIVETINGRRTAVITTHMDLDDISAFARLAARLSQERNMPLTVSAKWTIAKSEALFHRLICEEWERLGVPYSSQLTDVGIARVAVDLDGGWMRVFDNPNGDTAADVSDFVHGGHVMGSRVYCHDDEGEFFYEELPGGTAPDLMDTGMRGNTFFNPLVIILAFCSAFESVNPAYKSEFDRIRKEAKRYLNETPAEERDTQEMIRAIRPFSA